MQINAAIGMLSPVPIFPIRHNGTTHLRQLYSNLMGPPGQGIDLEQVMAIHFSAQIIL